MKTWRSSVVRLFIFVLAVVIQLYLADMTDAQADGKALELNGQGDFVEIPHSHSLDITGPFTIEVWIKYTPAHFHQAPIVAKGTTDEEWSGFSLSLSDEGQIIFSSGIARTKPVRSFSAISINHWYHIACVLQGNRANQAEIWINGFLDNTGTLEYPSGNSDALYVGQGRGSSPFEGEIDEVRIYNRALTEEEIESDMGIEIKGGERDIVAYYDFNELTPDRKVQDLSSHDNHGILRGDANLVLSDAPIFPSYEAMGEAAEILISQAETKRDQLKKEHVEIPSIVKHLNAAMKAFQDSESKTAFKYAHRVQTRLHEIWDALQNYVNIRKEVVLEVRRFKKEKINVSSIESKISKAEKALQEEDFKLARKRITDARLKVDDAWSTYEQIEKLKERIREVEKLGCDAGEAKNEMGEAVKAFNKGWYSRIGEHIQNGMILAKEAKCGKVKVMNLLAQAAKYDGKTVEITGQIKNIETVYDSGYKMAVDDGTGLIWIAFEGRLKQIDPWKNLDYLDKVTVQGSFSEKNAYISATKVR